jgi:hypothetical protein
MYATLAEESFAPVINRASKNMAASIDPLYERQEQEQQRRRDRMAQLSADVELDRRREETFAPKTSNLPAGMSLEHRVPLADRSSRPREDSQESPLPSAAPQLNAKSEAMVSGGARQHAEDGVKVRKQVQELWATNSDGQGSMDRRGAIQCLRSMGVQSNSTTQKFLLALGFVNGDDIPRSEHVLHVQYDRFQKVLTAVLKAATAEAQKKKAADDDAAALSAAAQQRSRGSSLDFQAKQHSVSSSHSRSRSPAVHFGAAGSRQLSTSPRAADAAISNKLEPSFRKVVRVDHPRSLSGDVVTASTRSTSVRSASQSTTDSFIRNFKDQRQKQQQHHHHQQPLQKANVSMSSGDRTHRMHSSSDKPSLSGAAYHAKTEDVGLKNTSTPRQNPSRKPKASRDADDVPFTFTPMINNNVVPKKERGPIHKRPAMSEETAAKLDTLRHQREHMQDDDCTFRPKTTEWTPSSFHQRQQQPLYRSERPSRSSGAGSAAGEHSHQNQDMSPVPRQQQLPKPHQRHPQDATRTVSIGYDHSDDDDEQQTATNHDDDSEEEREHEKTRRRTTAAGEPQRHNDHLGNHHKHANQCGRDHRTTRSHSSAVASTVPSLSTSVEGASSIAATMLGVAPGFETAVLRMRRARAEYKPKFEEGLRSSSRPTAAANRQQRATTRSLSSTNVNITGQQPPPQCLRHFDPTDQSPTFQRSSSSSHVKRSPTMSGGVFELSSSPQRTTEVEPFHFRTSDRTTEREHAKPLLYVDVDLPHGRTGRIGVHRGDTAQDLAIHFCATYSLDEATMYRLTDILQVKIDSVVQERTRSLWV